jgi:parallel beta-helix repeat protein
MKKIYLLLPFLFSFLISNAQTYMALQDNFEPADGDNIKFAAGEYTFPDSEKDGVIRIVGKQNIILDGDSVQVDGGGYEGYLIYLENSSGITIRNFDLGERFFYGVYAVNCDSITIGNCNFSHNIRTDEGWIVIFDGPELAHGGGVFMNECTNSLVWGNVATDQNDGAAIYNCDNITFSYNDFSWNTSYGIRMWYSDNCVIDNNNCSNVNRPLTDPSDCAALLMFRSHENTVTNNDLSYSGDGVFLTDYLDDGPGNNYIAYNDCSYSPHNAIEATFSDGNIFKYNICNHSNWGLWLGYSWNTLVDNNEIQFNAGLDPDQGGGIAIDRGYNNVITNNYIRNNHRGVRLWEGGLISPYTNSAHDYLIEDNFFFGNKEAVYADNVEHLVSTGNYFSRNFHDILIKGNADVDTISNCYFSTSAGFYIENKSTDDIFAKNNFFQAYPGLIDCKIFDENDSPVYGKVEYEPYDQGTPLAVMTLPPDDLAESPAIWNAYYYVEDGGETTIGWDTNDKKSGNASLFVDTEAGWDMHLHYFAPEIDTATWMASWALADTGFIRFWMKFNITDSTNFWGIQEGFIRLGDNCGNYYEYDMNPGVVNTSWGPWRYFEVPLTGNSNWTRTELGDMTFDEVGYIEFNVDVWGYGYELWLDGISLPVLLTATNTVAPERFQLSASPNPFSETTTLRFTLPKPADVRLDLFDTTGRPVRHLLQEALPGGEHSVDIVADDLPQGVYFCRLMVEGEVRWCKLSKA